MLVPKESSSKNRLINGKFKKKINQLSSFTEKHSCFLLSISTKENKLEVSSKGEEEKTLKKSKYHGPSPASTLNQMEFPSKEAGNLFEETTTMSTIVLACQAKHPRLLCYTPLTPRILINYTLL